MARRHREPAPQSSPGPHRADPAPLGMPEPEALWLGERLRQVALGLTAALLVTRFLFPGEDADDGTGLPWVLAVLGTALLGALAAWVGGVLTLRRSWADLAVAVLVLVVALSGASAGDHRAAITMTWEWVGLGVLYLLLRNLPQSGAEARALAGVLVLAAVAASAAGLFQVLVEDPATRRFYEANPERALRLAGIDPDDASSRTLLELRLFGSREPRAPYALANSLAGVLVGPLVIALAVFLLNTGRREGAGRLMPLLMAAPPLLLVLGCLLLTKSRSAYAGLLVGLLVVGWKLRGAVRTRTLALGAGALVLVLAALVAAGLATRQLDRAVLTEASKSLRYRAEYWAGTWGLITESPRTFLAGVGPGNFAGPYLRHKRPTSSEEIKDPHNLILDVWATSGIVAALALVAALGLGFRETLGAAAPPESRPDGSAAGEQPPPDGEDRAPAGRMGWIWLAAGFGWLLVVPLGGVNPFQADGQARWLILGGSGAWAAAMLAPLWRRRPVPGWAVGAGAVAVAVNLLAAGGVAIPPVALSLWAPIALGQDLRPDRPAGRCRLVARRWGSFSLAFAVAGLIGLFAGAVAVHDWPADAAMAQGRAELSGPHPDFDRALAAFVRAARLDTYAAEPWTAIADLEFRRWLAQGQPIDTGIRDRLAVAFRGATIPPRNPDALPVQRLRMELLRRVLELRGPDFDPGTERRLRLDLCDATAEAVRLYPTSPTLRAERAQAEAAVGRFAEAAREGREALRLDALTPHADKKLPEPVRDRLRAAIPSWEAPDRDAPPAP